MKPIDNGNNGRDQSGRFAQGNRAAVGRRPAHAEKAGRLRTAAIKAISTTDVQRVIKTLVKEAEAGNIPAARELLSRVSPTIKAEALPVEVFGMDDGDLIERATVALDAAAKGELSPDTASQLIAAIGQLAKVNEITELENRIEALERIQDLNK